MLGLLFVSWRSKQEEGLHNSINLVVIYRLTHDPTLREGSLVGVGRWVKK